MSGFVMLAQPHHPKRDEVTESSPQTTDEAELIASAASGDMVAFRELYDRHVEYVTKNVARLIGPSSDLEDVVQDVFVSVYRSLDNYRGDSKFTTWLYRVARNVTIDHIRKQPKHKTVELSDWRPLRANSDTWSKLEARDLLRALYAALDNVPAEHREVFLLHEVEGMKLREISELTGESINTIAARVRRTREKMTSVLERKEREADHG